MHVVVGCVGGFGEEGELGAGGGGDEREESAEGKEGDGEFHGCGLVGLAWGGVAWKRRLDARCWMLDAGRIDR